MSIFSSSDAFLKSPKRTKIVVGGVIAIIVLAVYFLLFYRPQSEKLNLQRAELSRLKKELNESMILAAELGKYKAEVEKMNVELEEAKKQLPTEKEIPEILKNISSLGRDCNLEFTLFRPKPEEPQQFYARVPIELGLVGGYHSVGLFFDQVSKQPRIINVVDFSMSRAKDTKPRAESKDTVIIKTSCTLNTYRYLEKKPEDKKGEGTKGEQKKTD